MNECIVTWGTWPESHYRRDGLGDWYLVRPDALVTVEKTIRELEALAATGEQP
jgi:hypothetical protein